MKMRILVLGAGATGGYFGGRLLQAGRDVTFLVRPGRAAELAASGLVIKSPYGDVVLDNPQTVTAENLSGSYDLILLSCKAYDLDDAVAAISPAVGPDTMILPLLNGMRHLEVLDNRFGRSKVLGGQCIIAATLDEERAIEHLNKLHSISFGERDGGLSNRVEQLAAVLGDCGFDANPSENILQAMWEKWIFLATLAAITCLMRASLGVVSATPGGAELLQRLFGECRAIAEAAGFAPRPEFIKRSQAFITAPDSPLTASMMRDLEAGYRIEADHVIGDLLDRRAAAGGDSPDVSLLQVAYVHLKAYEIRSQAASSESSAS
jgi:2-dehydropantoate 2-reductase